MASRVVEVLYKLKDLFTPTAKKVEKAYEDLGKSAKDAGKEVDKTNTAIGGTLGKLQARFNVLKTLAKGGVIGSAITGFISLVNEATENVVKLDRSAKKIGLSAQEFVDLRDIAGQAGLQVKDLESAFRTMESKLNGVALGSNTAAKSFERIGVNAEEFNRLDMPGKLERLAQAFVDLGANDRALAQIGKFIGARPGSDFLELIRLGPDRMRQLAEYAGQVGQTIGTDVVENAKRFQKISDELDRRWQSIASSVSNFAISTTVDVLRGLQIGDTQLERDLRSLAAAQANFNLAEERRLELLEEGREPTENFVKQYELAKENLEKYTKAVEDAEAPQRALAQAQEDALFAAEDITENYDEQVDAIEGVGKALEAQTKKVSENLKQQRREYNDARRDQIAVEREFQRLIEDVTGADVSVEDVTLGDVFGKLNQAQSASERGNLEEAVTLALQGADYLTLLKEKGTETQGTLGFLATQLSQVANQAAAARVEVEQGDVTNAEAVEQSLKGQIAAIEKIGENTGTAYAQSVYAAAQDYLDRNLVQPRIAPTAANGGGSGGYIEWADQPGTRKYIDGSGLK